MLPTRAEAFALLAAVGAPARLVRHAELVGEAADLLLAALAGLGVAVGADLVRAGAALHDVGKALHPDELARPGAAHEAAGERLLLARGVDAALARVCRSHAQWATMECSLEELVVALADKLWKGVRVAALEEAVIDRAAEASGRSRWDLYVPLDAAFEAVAAGGDARLRRS
jgi:hypothetical protein